MLLNAKQLYEMFNSPSSTKDERLVAGRAHARDWLGSAVMRRRRPPDWCRRMRRAAYVRRVWCAWWVGGRAASAHLAPPLPTLPKAG